MSAAATETAVPAAPARVKRPTLRLGLLFAGGLLANELLCNVMAVLDRFGGAKVTTSLLDDINRSALQLVGSLAEMLAVHAVLLLGLGIGWAAVSLTCAQVLETRLRACRAARLAFWSVNAMVFVNAWYSLHTLVFPGSRLCNSLLATLTGALRPGPLQLGALAVPALAGALVLLIVATALVRVPRLAGRGLLGAAVLIAVGAGYSWLTGPGPIVPFRADGSIVMLGVDSLQANRIGARDGRPDPAPHISGFLADAFRFENAWTPLARTYPSWLALLSGREPVHHGVRFNLAPDADLSRSNQYLPAALQAGGYSTLHATDETRFSIIRPMFGFQRLVHPRMGAQDFLLGSFFDFSAANFARQCAAGHDLFPAIALNRASVAYNPDLFVRETIKAIDELPRDQPAFIVVHLCGDHWPFTCAAPYSLRSDDPVANCIAMADDQVGALLDHLQAVGLRQTSTIALLSDHGDGWSGAPDDKTNSHGDDFRSLYGNRIVLGLQGPGLSAGSCTTQVRSFDLYPTLLERAGLPWYPDQIDGRSLLPVLRGEDRAERPVFAETDLDRNVYTVKILVQRHSLWYEVDPDSGLVHMRPQGRDEFMFYKHYLMVRDGLSLEVTPYQRRFRLQSFDSAAMRAGPAPPDGSSPSRAALVTDMARHFGLDPREWLDMAAATGFLAPSLAQGR